MLSNFPISDFQIYFLFPTFIPYTYSCLQPYLYISNFQTIAIQFMWIKLSSLGNVRGRHYKLTHTHTADKPSCQATYWGLHRRPCIPIYINHSNDFNLEPINFTIYLIVTVSYIGDLASAPIYQDKGRLCNLTRTSDQCSSAMLASQKIPTQKEYNKPQVSKSSRSDIKVLKKPLGQAVASGSTDTVYNWMRLILTDQNVQPEESGTT